MNEEKRQQLLNKEELTIPEAAELWGVEYRVVWRYVKAHLIEGYNIAPRGTLRDKWRVKTASLKERMGLEEDKVIT